MTQPHTPPPTGPAGYPPAPGPSGPARSGGFALTREKILALVVAAAALGTFISAFFSLYTARIAPYDWDGRFGIDVDYDFPGVRPSDAITVHMGFYDAIPFASPILAVAVPAAMIVAGVLAGAMALRGRYNQTGPTALAAVAATAVGLILLVVTPLPSVALSGELLSEFQRETGAKNIGELVDVFVPVRPGTGLILAFVFAAIGAIAAVALYALPDSILRPVRPQAAPGGYAPAAPGGFGPGYPGATGPGYAAPAPYPYPQDGPAAPGHPAPPQQAPQGQQPQPQQYQQQEPESGSGR